MTNWAQGPNPFPVGLGIGGSATPLVPSGQGTFTLNGANVSGTSGDNHLTVSGVNLATGPPNQPVQTNWAVMGFGIAPLNTVTGISGSGTSWTLTLAFNNTNTVGGTNNVVLAPCGQDDDGGLVTLVAGSSGTLLTPPNTICTVVFGGNYSSRFDGDFAQLDVDAWATDGPTQGLGIGIGAIHTYGFDVWALNNPPSFGGTYQFRWRAGV